MVTDFRAEEDPEGVLNVKRGTTLGTAHGFAKGKKLWRVVPGADLA